MATFEELLKAAKNAHDAGDAASARKLVQAAQSMRAEQPRTFDAEMQYDSQGRAVYMAPPSIDAAFTPTPERQDVFGDTTQAVVAGPVAATKHYASQTVAPGRNPLQRAGDAALTGLNALGAGVAFGAGVAGEAFGGSPTRERQLARDLLMASSVAVPELAGVSATTRAAARSAQAAGRLEGVPSSVEAGARAAEDLGIRPSVGMTGKTGGMVAATLEKVPGAGQIIARDAERAVGEIEGAFKRIVGNVGDVRSASGAGDVLQSGLIEYRERFKSRATQLYGDVARHLPADARVEIPNTLQSWDAMKALLADNPEMAKQLGMTRFDRVFAEAQANGVPWQLLSDFRTTVGEAVGSVKGPLADQADGRLKALYGTLTQDMEAAARAAGGDAFKAWRKATNYYRLGAERIEKSLDKLIRPDAPERAFEIFSAMTKEGKATADINRLREVKKSMPRDDWNQVAASIVDRLGRAKPGQQGADGATFSAGTFLTEWNTLSPQAKALLLPEEARMQLNQLAQVAERAKAAGAERNFSNTGTVTTGIAVGAGLASAPITTLSLLAGANVSARFMTTPFTLRVLNKWARGDAADLRRLANGNGPFAQDAATVLRLSAAQSAAGAEAANTSTRPLRAAIR